MPDLLISLALGGVMFCAVKWLIFRKPFPYPLSVAKQYRLGKALTKLSDVMEAIERTQQTNHIGMRGSVQGLPTCYRAKAENDFNNSMAVLIDFDPEVITYVALGQIRTSVSLGRQSRASAQSRMLDVLNREGLAIPADLVR